MALLLFESAVRAVLIAAGTAVVLWAFGIRNDAARHKAWTGVVVLMLLLPIWTATGPRVAFEVLRPAPVSAEISTLPANRVPGALPTRGAAAEPARSLGWQSLLLGIYLLGASALLLRLALGTVQAHRLIRNAVMQEGRRTSGACASPITVGSLRPVVILPETWQRWPKAQLDAVLTHEGEHVRRCDPLVQWLALLNRAVFWFHPLAWWLERRLAALAEGACDSAVLAAGHSPQDYSEYLLDLARLTMREGKRLSVVGMAMPGRYLTHRIQQILEGVPMQPISRTRIAFTLVLCTISSVVFAATTLAPQQHVNPLDPAIAQAPPLPPLQVSQDPRKQSTEDKLNVPLSPEVNPLQGSGTRTLPSVIDSRNRFVAQNTGAIGAPNAALPAAAQSQADGRLTGTVTDARGAVVPLATVIVSTPDGTTREIASTGGTGTFTVAHLPASTYLLQVFAPGFGPSRVSIVAVPAGQDTRHDVQMDMGFVQNTTPVSGVSVFSASAASGSRSVRARIGGNVARSNLIQRVDPVYPDEAKQNRIQGTVVLEIEIGIDGRVGNVRAIAGNPLLVPAAMDAVRQWIYRPFPLNGAPIPVVTTTTINFAFQQ